MNGRTIRRVSNAAPFPGTRHALAGSAGSSGLASPRYTGEQIDDNAEDCKDDPGDDDHSPNEKYDDSEDRYGRSWTRAPDRPVRIAPNQEAPQGGDNQTSQHRFEVAFDCSLRVVSRVNPKTPARNDASPAGCAGSRNGA